MHAPRRSEYSRSRQYAAAYLLVTREEIKEGMDTHWNCPQASMTPRMRALACACVRGAHPVGVGDAGRPAQRLRAGDGRRAAPAGGASAH